MFESEYSVLLGSSWFLIIVGLMIGSGGLIMIVSICGCYGVVKEHRYFLVSVSRLKSLKGLSLAHIAGVLSQFPFKYDSFTLPMNHMFVHYHYNKPFNFGDFCF